MKERMVCELCQCEVPKLTRHHLIPKKLHRKNWFKKRYTWEQMQQTVDLCVACHKEIHTYLDHKELGQSYNTLEKLQSHEGVKRYVKWRRKKEKWLCKQD